MTIARKEALLCGFQNQFFPTKIENHPSMSFCFVCSAGHACFVSKRVQPIAKNNAVVFTIATRIGIGLYRILPDLNKTIVFSMFCALRRSKISLQPPRAGPSRAKPSRADPSRAEPIINELLVKHEFLLPVFECRQFQKYI